MKQKIPLTEHNKKILITHYGMQAEQFTEEYWIKQVVNSESNMQLILKRSQADNIEKEIRKRARRLKKKYINNLLKLPGKSGSMEKQRRWHKLFDKTGLIR
jgi:predicted GIY-YIG superfamily endonuclease